MSGCDDVAALQNLRVQVIEQIAITCPQPANRHECSVKVVGRSGIMSGTHVIPHGDEAFGLAAERH
ncbi:hypothetical protein [Loktanella sp. R86503]|uniref:hypothetical protein n=1 Tax=Loktanella sp. R86503 TaxID=3093847 RepID=UPI0036DA3687